MVGRAIRTSVGVSELGATSARNKIASLVLEIAVATNPGEALNNASLDDISGYAAWNAADPQGFEMIFGGSDTSN